MPLSPGKGYQVMLLGGKYKREEKGGGMKEKISF
jgi:hypothetical protein